MNNCPFCTKEIPDDATQCSSCGKLLLDTAPGSTAGNTPVTRIQPERWSAGAVVLRSDGTARALLDVIATAAESAGYPITHRSYPDMTLHFESRGMTWNSFAGDVTTVLVTQAPDGARATFTSRSKPVGLTRAQPVKATKWVQRLIPGFGDRWSDTPVAVAAQESPRAASAATAQRPMSTCPACGQAISVGGQFDHWKSHVIVAPGDGHPGGFTWSCSCKDSPRFPQPDEATALVSLAIHMGLLHQVAPDQPMERWLKERGVTPNY